MTIYNVTVPVIALLESESPEQAQEKLGRALERAGFTVYTPDDPANADLRPFESESGVEAEVLR